MRARDAAAAARQPQPHLGLLRHLPAPPATRVGGVDGAHENEDEDIDHAIALSLSEEDQSKGKAIDTGHRLDEDEQLARALQENTGHSLDEDEQLARALQESMNDGTPHRDVPIEDVHSESAPASSLPPLVFPTSGSRSCYKERFHPKSLHFGNQIPTNKNGLIEYRAHPFWMQKYCPSHENDGTPRCCSCEWMEGHHLPETRGLCLSEEQIVRTILKRPIIGPDNKIIDMITGPYKLVRRCEVTAILILYGLPRYFSPINSKRIHVFIFIVLTANRLLTGSILAHEMMHAYLRLKGYRTLSPEVEEGICQVLAHLWLDSEITAGSGTMATTSAASSSSSTSSSSKKGAKTEFEKRLGEFFKHQIETDSSAAYGDGFRAGMRAVERYGLRSTLDHIKLTGSFPY
nr:unnamed protein product [Digitaria exilis]